MPQPAPATYHNAIATNTDGPHMNTQHTSQNDTGFLGHSINPDAVIAFPIKRISAELTQLISLFDRKELLVGDLQAAYDLCADDMKLLGILTVKDWLWWLCEQVDTKYTYGSAQSKYANMIALFGSGVEEYNLGADVAVQSLIIEDAKPFSLSRQQHYFNSLVSKINALRTSV